MSELQKLEKRMDKRFDDFTALINEYTDDGNARFDAIEQKLAKQAKVELN